MAALQVRGYTGCKRHVGVKSDTKVFGQGRKGYVIGADGDERHGRWGRIGETQSKYLSFAVVKFEIVSGYPIPDFSNAVLDGVGG